MVVSVVNNTSECCSSVFSSVYFYQILRIGYWTLILVVELCNSPFISVHFFLCCFERSSLGCVRAQSLHSCPTLCDPMDRSLLRCSVHGILQARVLEWVTIPFSSRYLPNPGIKTMSPASPALQVNSFLLSHQGSPLGWVYFHKYYIFLTCWPF